MIGSLREERQEYLGFAALEAVHPDDRDLLLSQVSKSISENLQISCEFRARKNDGTYMWLRVRADIFEKTDEKSTFYCAFTDIDQLRKALEEQEKSHLMLDRILKESQASEKRFKSIMDHVPGAMVVFDVREKLLWLRYISDGCINITGFTAEETYKRSGKDPLRDAHPDSRQFFLDNEWNDIQQKKNLSYKYQLYCKNGSYKWVILNLTPVEENGELHYYGVLRDLDVDEQKYQEKEDYYNQLITIMDQLDDENLIAKGRYNINKNEKLYYYIKNGEALKLPDDITFDAAKELLIKTAAAEEYRIMVSEGLDRDKLLKEFEEGTLKGSIKYKRREVSSAYFWTDIKYYMCSDPATDDVMFFIYSYDITKDVLESSMLSMLGATEYEVMGTIDVVTHHFETQAVCEFPGELFNRKDKNASGSYDKIWIDRIIKYVPDFEREKLMEQMSLDNVQRKLVHNKSYFVTYSVLEADGQYHRKKMQYSYLDESHDTIFYYRSDITATYTREQEQIRVTEKALESARVANDAKTEFFSRMSHDMRTPMNGILGLAGLSADEESPEILRENMSKIMESGKYLLSLINDTLDFQKIESGKMQLDPQPVHSSTIVQNVLDMVKPAVEDKKINFSVINHNVDFDCYLNIDPVRYRQIFINLLSNAIKFTPEGGNITVECECLKREGNKVSDKFIIRDTGIGMSAEFLKNGIFKPFSQENNEQTMKYAGTGLGLSIVRSLVDLMNGSIEVESEPGTGTAFTIYLDFEKVDISNIAREEKENQQKKENIISSLKGKRILLAEDHPLNAEIAIKLLEKAGCIITWVKNGKECVQTFAEAQPSKYDVILMDIRMPVMDGLEAAAAIRGIERADAKTVPILAMTANAYDEDVKRSLKAGMNGHLSKPIDPSAMYAKIAQALDDSTRSTIS